MNLLQNNPRKASFLTRYRPRFRQAWLLHFCLILSLLLLPAGRLARADGEGEFTLTGTQGSVAISVSAPQGTSGMQPGDTRQIIANAQVNTWEVWTNSETGATEIRNPLTVPMAGSWLAFSNTGDGWLSPFGGVMTDSNGTAVSTFTIGSTASTVTVNEGTYGGSGSLNFDAPVVIIPETWTWNHDERLITASLACLIPNAATESVSNGEIRMLGVHVDVINWSVYTSNYGNTRTDNYSTSPVEGASVSMSVQGDGTVAASGASGWYTTDQYGNAYPWFTMGSTVSIVRADVSCAGSSATYATLQFNPAPVETWTLDHVDNYISGVTANVDDGGTALVPGAQRSVRANVIHGAIEVWVSNFGNTEYRNFVATPAVGETVSFSFVHGDGSLSANSATTDGNGNAWVDFTMGTVESELAVTCGGYPTGIVFSPASETWAFDHTTSALSFSGFTADGATDNLRPGNTRTLTAAVVNTTWEVWLSNFGNTQDRNLSVAPAAGIGVGFAVASGDGQLSTTGSMTDYYGNVSVTFTMGTTASTVQAALYDPTNGPVTTSITLSLGDPVWAYDHTETTITTNLTANGSTDELPSGTVRVLTAHVAYNTWEVWKDDTGNSRSQNPASGAANGASMNFAVTQGDGTLANAAAATDANGDATVTFTMGGHASTVQADASYAGASSSGDITFTPDPWTYDHSENALTVTLGADETAMIAIANVRIDTWEVYKNNTTYEYEERYRTSSPIGGASVSFSGDENITVDTPSATTNSAGTATTRYSSASGNAVQGWLTAWALALGASATDTYFVSTAASPTYKFDFEASDDSLASDAPSKFKQQLSMKFSDTAPEPDGNEEVTGSTKFDVNGTATSGGFNDTTYSAQVTNLVVKDETGTKETIPSGVTITFKMDVTVSLKTATVTTNSVTRGSDADVWNLTLKPTLLLTGDVSNVAVFRTVGGQQTQLGNANIDTYTFTITWKGHPFTFTKEVTQSKDDLIMNHPHTREGLSVSKMQPQ
jgi:hypothetical protein